MKRTKKSTKQRKVLVASVLLAMLIVAGGTFAWFTSSDEVTNKLSASNNYGVTITENFTPPSQWVPGEKVSKEVAVINTGNIDAFVKLSLKNTIDVTVLGEEDESFDAANVDKYVVLTDAEVASLQAGGILVCSKGAETEDQIVGTDFDASKVGEGLYIFRRSTVDEYEYEYAGYYYYNNTFYAINPTSSTTAKLPKRVQKTNQDLTLDYTEVVSNNRVIATYAGDASSTDDDIVVYINLDENEAANWTLIDNEFYYNKLLEAGSSTGNLVTSVELADTVNSNSYISFDYYLTVTTDSAQVTTDDAKTTAVNGAGWSAQAALSGTSVTWTKE